MAVKKEPRFSDSGSQILLSEVGKSYDLRTVLAGINLQIDPGELIVICGRNAVGKSTLLRMLAGLDETSSGEIEIKITGQNSSPMNPVNTIGFMGHDSCLYDQLSAGENLRFFADMYGTGSSTMIVKDLMQEYDLTAAGNLPSGLLSRGTKQRLSFARALVSDPDILLLDEPFAGLDPAAARTLVHSINRFRDKGRTVILTTHDFSNIGLENLRLLLLEQRTILYDGLCRDLQEAREIYERASNHSRKSGIEKGNLEIRNKSKLFKTWENSSLQESFNFFDLAKKYLFQVAAVMKKDWRTEIKSRESTNVMLLFALSSLIIYSFAFNLMGASVRELIPGILWTTLSFTGILGLYRTVDREFRNSCMDALRLAAIEDSSIFLGKTMGILGPLLLIYFIVSFLLNLFFRVNIFDPLLFLINLVGIFGFASAGTVLTTLAEKTSAKEILLPVLLLPVLIPLLLSVVQINLNHLDGLDLKSSLNWIRLLVVYNLIVTAASMLTYHFVLKG